MALCSPLFCSELVSHLCGSENIQLVREVSRA